MSRVLITGAAGPVGRRLCRLVAADETVDEVVALDRLSLRGGMPDKVRVERLELRRDPLDAVFSGIDVVCHLAGTDSFTADGPSGDVHKADRVLAAAAVAGVGHVVVRTSATVYGAWENNPVPITEAQPLRPNPEAAWVVSRAEIEAIVDRHRRDRGAHVAVLRPVVTVSEDGPDELGRVLAAARIFGAGESNAPVQFVHADDVAAAIDLARRQRLDGAYNVAPDGWLDTDTVSALVGGSPRLRMPAPVARALHRVGWQSGALATPPGYEPFVSRPWVVASDRLRAAGWVPTNTNEEAFVAGHRAAPWAQISPQRRQELALGIAGAAVAGGIAAGATVLRRRLHSR